MNEVIAKVGQRINWNRSPFFHDPEWHEKDFESIVTSVDKIGGFRFKVNHGLYRGIILSGFNIWVESFEDDEE